MSPPPSIADSTAAKYPSTAAAAEDANNVLTVFQQPEAETTVVLDALPYIDQVHEEYEQYATSLIEQEMKKASSSSSSSSKRKLPPLAPIHFRTPFMKEQYERLEKKGQGMSSSATTFSEASTIDLSPPLEENSIQAWQDAVKRVKIGYERERIRAMLLELEKGGDNDVGIGIAALEWKMHNALLEQTESYYQGLSQMQQEVVEGINLQRHEEQQKQGQELMRVTAQYEEVQLKLVQLRKAVFAMEQEVQQQKQE
jgi:hypothetical protein